MSRIRSQLDSLLQEPHPHHQERQASPGAAAEPGRGNPDAYREGRPGQDGQPAADASGAGAPTQSHELDRIRAIIEDLTGKIGTASAGRPAQQQPQPAARPAPQAAPAHTVEAPPARREAGLDIGSALSGEIRRQMNDESTGCASSLAKSSTPSGRTGATTGCSRKSIASPRRSTGSKTRSPTRPTAFRTSPSNCATFARRSPNMPAARRRRSTLPA